MSATFDRWWIPRALLAFAGGWAASVACAAAVRYWFDMPREVLIIATFLWIAPVMFFGVHRLREPLAMRSGRTQRDVLAILITGASLIGTWLAVLFMLDAAEFAGRGNSPLPILVATGISGLTYAATWVLSWFVCRQFGLLVPKAGFGGR